MKRMFLFIVIYLLASLGVQAQVINPDGLKEMWVNDKIDGKIYISPDSTSYFHFYYLYTNPNNPKILKLYKRDLITNDVLIEKDIDDFGDERRMPEMALSPDGKYIIISLNRIFNHLTPIMDTLFVYNQQNLEFIKAIHLDINEITEGMYDAEEIEAQIVMIHDVYTPMFVTNDKFTVKGKFSGKDFVPEEYRIKGYFSCIYNIETGEFINEYDHTYTNKDIFIKEFKLSPDKTHVLIETLHIPIEQFLDLIENEVKFENYERVYEGIVATNAYNTESNLVAMGLKNGIAVYDLKNHKLIADEKMNYYYTEPAIINKQFITINNRENIHAVALYDFINKRFYNLIDKITAFGQHNYIKGIKYLIF